MVERELSRAESLFGEGKSRAKITKEKTVKTIRPIRPTKTEVETKPKNLIQNLRLLKLDCCKNGWLLLEALAASLGNFESLEVNLRLPGLCVNVIKSNSATAEAKYK